MAYATMNAAGTGAGLTLTSGSGNVTYAVGTAGNENYGVIFNDGRAPVTVGLTVANISTASLRQGVRVDGSGRPKSVPLTIASNQIDGVEVPAQGSVHLIFTNSGTTAAAWRVDAITSQGHNEVLSINNDRQVLWG